MDSIPCLSCDRQGQEELLSALQRGTGQAFRLAHGVRVGGWPPMNNVKVTERHASALYLQMWPDELSSRAPLHCKVLCQESGEELAAQRLISLLNARWAREKLDLLGVPLRCPQYACEFLGDGLFLLEEPAGVTLGELKRRCGEHTRTRVAEYLSYEPQKVARLAASCAATLACSYILGAAAGDGDTLRLLPDGALLRTQLVGLFGCGAMLDAPPVWLPKAVTCALGDQWIKVQHMANVAFQVASVILSPLPRLGVVAPWAQAQTLLLQMEQLLYLNVSGYLSGLSSSDFQAALAVADDTIGKRVSSVLHDFFGYRSGSSSGQLGERTVEQLTKASAVKRFLAAEHEASTLCLSWAMRCPSWPLAVRIVAALCGEPERLLRLHCEDLSILARQAADLPDGAWLRDGALRSLATLVRHSGSEVCSWLASCCAGESLAPLEVFELARSLREMRVPVARESMKSKEAFLLELGSIVTLARLLGPTGRQAALPEIFSELAASVAKEATVSRCVAAQSAVQMLNEDDRLLLVEFAQHLSGYELAAALRSLEADDFGSALRRLEAEAKGPELGGLARQCLGALARDASPAVSRPALCAIACAVHDENKEVRLWARKFLTDASWSPSGHEAGSMHFFVSMVRNMVVDEDRR